MTRREIFSGLGALIERPQQKNRRSRHPDDRLYHGPIAVPNEVVSLAGASQPYRTTHRHPVLRVEHDRVVYLFRCLPAGAVYLGELVRTPHGSYRIHVWRAIADCPTAPKVEKLVARWVPGPGIPVIGPVDPPEWKDDQG